MEARWVISFYGVADSIKYAREPASPAGMNMVIAVDESSCCGANKHIPFSGSQMTGGGWATRL